MFARIMHKVHEHYLLPVLITTPVNAFAGLYEEYIRNESYPVSFTQHTFSCVMGGFTGAINGMFLGAVWPISLPLYVARTINKK
jgi:hypothetical protein